MPQTYTLSDENSRQLVKLLSDRVALELFEQEFDANETEEKAKHTAACDELKQKIKQFWAGIANEMGFDPTTISISAENPVGQFTAEPLPQNTTSEMYEDEEDIFDGESIPEIPTTAELELIRNSIKRRSQVKQQDVPVPTYLLERMLNYFEWVHFLEQSLLDPANDNPTCGQCVQGDVQIGEIPEVVVDPADYGAEPVQQTIISHEHMTHTGYDDQVQSAAVDHEPMA